MSRCYLVAIVFIVIIGFYGCSQDHTDQTQTLATINDYRLSLKDFQRQLAQELEFIPDAKLTQEVKKAFLDEIIRKEVLIQEAKKMGLDQQEKFIHAIERYWESTLIRNLIELKSEEIQKRILISEEEIKDYYSRMEKTTKETPLLEQYREHIINMLKEQKKTRMLGEWINAIKDQSKIQINNELLKAS